MRKLQPHKNEYWLFPKIKDWEGFKKEVSEVCETIKSAFQGSEIGVKVEEIGAIGVKVEEIEAIGVKVEEIQGKAQKNCHVISIDEKTGIQALERIQQIAPTSKGGHKRTEFEYERHGTTTLIGALNVGTGKIIHERIHPTRTEVDMGIFLTDMLNKLPQKDDIVILADHLNTHLSETVVRIVAEKIGYKDDLGEKGITGILHNIPSRKLFLTDKTHRVRFLYTPKHCSWLNPIENWFAKIQRQVLTKASVESVAELETKIAAYIEYYNDSLFKPLKWKFSGFHKNKELKNFTVAKT